MITMDKIIEEYYSKNEDKYFSQAIKDIGVRQRDYYAPDGYILADLSGWKNENEIFERALELYIDEFLRGDEDLIDCIINDYAENEEQATEIEEYIKSRDYKDLYKIFY